MGRESTISIASLSAKQSLGPNFCLPGSPLLSGKRGRPTLFLSGYIFSRFASSPNHSSGLSFLTLGRISYCEEGTARPISRLTRLLYKAFQKWEPVPKAQL